MLNKDLSHSLQRVSALLRQQRSEGSQVRGLQHQSERKEKRNSCRKNRFYYFKDSTNYFYSIYYIYIHTFLLYT